MWEAGLCLGIILGEEYVWVDERQFRWGRRDAACGKQAAKGSCCPGSSPRGRRAGWERSAAVRRELASGCLRPTVFMRADSILFYIKRIASKMLVSAINIFTWKKT